MKRPLCVFALILTAAVFLYLELLYPDIAARSYCPAPDGSYTEITGRVSGKEPVKGYDGTTQVAVYISGNDSMSVQCYLDGSDAPAIGTFARIGGKVKEFSSPTNPGEFDSRLYYNTLKISYRITDARVLGTGGEENRYREALWRLKVIFGDSLDDNLSPEDAGIMKAMLLGDKSSLDSDVQSRFKAAGVVHVLCISGTHIALLGMLLYRLLKRIADVIYLCGKRFVKRTFFLHLGSAVACILSVMAMYSYGVMCGMGSSAFRAILMFSLRLLAPVLGRTYDILTSLALSEILLLLYQPLYIYNSGFLMSFGAVVGIVVIKPCLTVMGLSKGQEMRFVDDKKSKGISGEKVSDFIKGGVLTSVSIGIATLPVYGLYYYTYPLHSIILNLLVIPVLGVLLALGAGAVIIKPLGLLVHLILSGYSLISSFSGLNAAFTWYMGHPARWQAFTYLCLICLFVIVTKRYGESDAAPSKTPGKSRTMGNGKTPDTRRRSFFILFRRDIIRYAILLAAVVIFSLRFHPDLEVNMIDVGQGDSILVSSKGRNLLIDGGSTSKKNVGKYRIIPFLKYKGIGKLDAVAVTHEDEDHISGILDIMDDMEMGGIRIKKLLLPEVAEITRGENYHILEQRAVKLGIPILYINSGEGFNIGEADLTCLNPARNKSFSGANEYSMVLHLRCGEFTALFTGDVEGEGQEYLRDAIKNNLPLYADVDLLKVAHHGSQYTTDCEFLGLVRPGIALISCGKNNSYGHPHEELLDRLNQAGSMVYRTDKTGCITVKLNGKALRVRGFISQR
ncbi:ComEC/Rec2 family competence protein [Butyrivibrio sp. FCS014]|uniref:ComEC/Rec2 family competence protein n=1 Tax=Butyrivibrio sp. FCS014 TaxID=1408304 RepID=UPI000465CE4F|nr:ComEC/Rec2 family competence protein [Butyrivibrio sp. FCS014]